MSLAHDVHLQRDGRPVLRGVSVEARPGRLLAVLGPNGAGKSTLLRLLAGDPAPTRGEVTLDGLALSAWSPSRLARRRAVMLQDPAVSWPFTAREYARLGRLPHGDQRLPSADLAVDRALSAVDAAAFAGRPMSRLSGGERRRVQAARALVQVDGVAGPLLLLDEPVANLDPSAQHRLLAAMRARARAGAAVVAVLHDVSLALAWADDALLLREGAAVAAGACAAALTPASLEAAFGVPFVLLDSPHSSSRFAAALCHPQEGPP
ncbi:MAG: ATP-binding cassette domain-containing protein [Deltaproteobacteria bacterium]|nr:ATP-binding cassette domain-containing protein [Myxococcales bacterium]MDP3217541.1 ATP-binding cassette domain-containing protein [Deltaproteobacteria bacterium]